MKKTLEIGDIVKLNSGGPDMTVTDLPDSSGWVKCKWFNHDAAISGAFPEDSLTLQNDKS